MHPKLSLTIWFWAAHLMATHSNGMSAQQLKGQLGLSYNGLAAGAKTAAVDGGPGARTIGRLVEVDQTEMPFRADNSFFEITKTGKMIVIGAVEVINHATGKAQKPTARLLDESTSIPCRDASGSQLFQATTLPISMPSSRPTLRQARH